MVKEDRKNRCRGPCTRSTNKVPKKAEIESTCLFIYRRIPTTKTGGTMKADNNTNEVVITENSINAKMTALDIVPDIDKYEVTCPRCRYKLQRAQRQVQQIPIKGFYSKYICTHCQAQINDQCQMTKEQFIYCKIKSEGNLLRREKEEELLKDTKKNRFKGRDVSLSTIRRERQKAIHSKIGPWIRPLISSLKSDDELHDVRAAIKKVSIKESIEGIEPRHGSSLLDDNSDSKLLLPPTYDDMLLDKESGIFTKITKPPAKTLLETETKTKRNERNRKQFTTTISRYDRDTLENHLSITTLLSRLSEAPQNFLKDDFHFNFPRRAKKNLSQSKTGESKKNRILTTTDSLLRMQAEEKKKKKIEEKEKKKQDYVEKKKETEKLNELQRKEGVSDSSMISIRGKSTKKRFSSTLESEPSKTDELLHKTGRKRGKRYDLDESVEDLGKSTKGRKSEERIDKKKQEKGQQDLGQKQEGKDEQFKKESIRGKQGTEKAIPLGTDLQALEKVGKKIDKEKELTGPGKGLPGLSKGLQRPGKDEEKSDKEKALPTPAKGLLAPDKEKALLTPAKGLLASEQDKKKSYKDKALSTYGKGVPEQNNKISDQENVLPVARKDKEISDKEKVSLVTPSKGLVHGEKEEISEDEKKWYLPPGEDNEKSNKGKSLPAIGKRLPAPLKDKEIPEKEKGLQEHVKEKAVPASGKGLLQEKEEKTDEEKVKHLAPGQKKKEIPGVLKKGKMENLKKKNDVTAADDAVLGTKTDTIKHKATKSKGVEEKKTTIKEKDANEKEKDLVDKNKITPVSAGDNVLSNLILQMKDRKIIRKVPTSIFIPPPPVIKPKPTRKVIVSAESDDWKSEMDLVETEESSVSVDEVVYKNKVINKHKIPPAHVLSETKERAADIVYNNIFKDDLFQRTLETPQPTKVAHSKEKLMLTKDTPTDGIMRYALSDRTYIDKGWTLLPVEKVVCKTNVYRMRPAHPEFDWFQHNKVKGVMHYNSGEKLAEFKDDRLGQWFYRNGRLALNYYDSEDTNAQQRVVIYSNGELDERGRSHPVTILGMFDYVGNGVIFDHSGKIRLKYNQTEGILLDREIGPTSHWKWHSLNDPPVLQQVMIDTQMLLKDPRIAQLGTDLDKPRPETNKDMVAIEFENAIKEKSQKMTEKFKPFQIKMKALKINENFSIRILDQASIYLLFRDGTTNLKLNLGMLLDSHEIVDTDTEDLGEISTGLERLPAKTESIATMQRNIKFAQHFDKIRTERERRLRLPELASSVDRINTLVSKPLKPPLTAVNCVTAISGGSERYYSRKPAICALYYNNRLN